jgi:hypothetical protein
MMTFAAVVGEAPLEGILKYVEAEHSFMFDVASPADLQARSGAAGVTSLSVGTLQIEVGVETGRVLFVWGLHPRVNWNIRPIGRPSAVEVGARVEASVPLQRGVTLPLAPVGAWTTSFDDATGWVRVAKFADSRSEQDLLVATGIALGLTNAVLDSLWLHPVFE